MVQRCIRRLLPGALAGLLLLAGCVSAQPASRAIPLAVDGHAQAVIVIPAMAPPPVTFAAAELKEYLEQITGASFVVSQTLPPSGAAIVLGETLAAAAGITTDSLRRDGYVIQTVGDRIYIAGHDDPTDKAAILFMLNDASRREDVQKTWIDRNENFDDSTWDFDRGTLHGAYDFLERLGARWFFPGELGEIVPHQPTLHAEALEIRQEPWFAMRKNGRIIYDVMFESQKQVYTDRVRAEYDALGWTPQNQKLWLLRNRESSTWLAFNHRPSRQQWSERFGLSHPEYFALLPDGTRATSGRGYLNYASAGMLAETIKDMDAFFSGQPPESRGLTSFKNARHTRGWDPTAAYGDYFSLLPNDGLRVDHSPASQALIHADKPLFFRHTNYIWQFVNQAALALKKSHPDKFVTCLAYQSYAEVPDPEVVSRLPDNVIVGLAALSGCSRINTFMIDKSRREYLDLLRRWSTMSEAPMLFWTYWLYRAGQSDRFGVPLLLPHGAQQFVRAHAPYGRFWFMEHDIGTFTFEMLNRYLMFRLLWNPECDMDALLDDFCAKAFGPAAAIMRAMLADIEKRCMINAATNADQVAIWEQAFPADTLQYYHRTLDEAKKLTARTPHARRVELMSRFFITPMEEGRQLYLDRVKTVRDSGKDALTAYPSAPGAIIIDGEWDSAWKSIGGRPFFNNVNGQTARPPAIHRLRCSAQDLYLLIDIPSLPGRAAGPFSERDYVEIFLDANRDRETYHWLQIFPDGRIAQFFFPGPGEPPLDWDSQAAIKTVRTPTGWLAEIALPFQSIALNPKELESTTMGVLFCVTRGDCQGQPDMFSSSSPILRGAFHQPGLFNPLQFAKPD